MNIQNVQIQAFLDRIQSKVMRKIEDEYYCGTLAFKSQDQLDQFKATWQLKLKQQFAAQNNQNLNKSAKIPFQAIEDPKIASTASTMKQSTAAEMDDNSTKQMRKSSARKSKGFHHEAESEQLELNPMKKMKIQPESSSSTEKEVIKGKDDEKQNEKSKGEFEVKSDAQSSKEKGKRNDDLDGSEKKDKDLKGGVEDEDNEDSQSDFLKYFLDEEYRAQVDKQVQVAEEKKKKDEEDNFELNSDDLDDVSDQVIDEDYFQNFDNVLVGFITKERKTKKRSKQGNHPLASIEFSHLLGTINSQEILISNLRANLIDCRK